MHRFKHGWMLGALACVAATGTLAACGSDDDSTSSTPAAAQTTAETTASEPAGNDVVAAAQKIADANVKVEKIGPTVKLDKVPPKGEKVVYVNCGQPSCTSQGKALKDAATSLGWTYSEIASQPTPEAVQSAFTEAIRRAPDVVVSAGFGASLYPRQIAEMAKKDIKVMSITGNEESGEKGITYEPLGPKGASDAMRVLANKTIADLGGKGEVGSVELGGYPIVKTYTAAYEDEIKTKCPDCTVKHLEIQPTSLGKDAATIIANFMRKNPDMKGIYYSYDLMGSGVAAAAKGAGLTDLPLSYSWAPDAPGLQALKTGERKASMLMPFNELSWMVADAAARLATGGSVAQSSPTQHVQLVSADYDNVPATADPYPPSVADYKEQFKALWGV